MVVINYIIIVVVIVWFCGFVSIIIVSLFLVYCCTSLLYVYCKPLYQYCIIVHILRVLLQYIYIYSYSVYYTSLDMIIQYLVSRGQISNHYVILRKQFGAWHYMFLCSGLP